MHRTHPGRPALIRLALAASLAALIALALTSASKGSPANAATAASVSVRVEGSKATLLHTTDVALPAAKVVKNAVAADSCAGASAAAALQSATHGDWSGSWSASYHGYFLTAIEGLALPASGAEFWAFWVNDAPAPTGICAYDPKPGDQLLFFPDCYGKKCPKTIGVLGVRAPAVVTAGRAFTVTVTAYSDANGKPSRAAGATIAAGDARAKAGASGTATLTITQTGTATLNVTAPHAVRTEATLCVAAAAAKSCG